MALRKLSGVNETIRHCFPFLRNLQVTLASGRADAVASPSRWRRSSQVTVNVRV